MYCDAALPGGVQGDSPVLLFFCRRFLFQIKRKCRNAGSIKYSIVARREGRVQILQFHIVTLPRQSVVEVADPYKLPLSYLLQCCGAAIESLIIKIG